jgi:hypothetical protein
VVAAALVQALNRGPEGCIVATAIIVTFPLALDVATAAVMVSLVMLLLLVMMMMMTESGLVVVHIVVAVVLVI